MKSKINTSTTVCLRATKIKGNERGQHSSKLPSNLNLRVVQINKPGGKQTSPAGFDIHLEIPENI
jgi:hypothetical protein